MIQADFERFPNDFVWQSPCSRRQHGHNQIVSRSTRLAEVHGRFRTVLRVSRRFRRDDQMPLGYEIRKSCVSVPSNIAEGYGRHSTPEYIHHLRYSNGSNNELQTQIEVARRVEIVSTAEASTLIADAEEVGRMLYGLVGSLERRRR